MWCIWDVNVDFIYLNESSVVINGLIVGVVIRLGLFFFGLGCMLLYLVYIEGIYYYIV